MPNNLEINLEYLNALKENIKDPFLILDKQGNILFHNTEAESFFSISGKPNLYSSLDQDSSEKINEMLLSVLQNNSRLEETFVVGFNQGEKINVQVIINPVLKENKSIVFCTIKPLTGKFTINDKTYLSTTLSEIEKNIYNQEVIKTLEEIRKNYPFTFVSKNKIRKIIDGLEEFIWIKNPKGFYILVNNKVQNAIGLNIHQIEGKQENNFLPPYIVKFQEAIDQYLIDSANCIILEGTRFKGFYNSTEFETIEIPLFNSLNEISAIIGIGQKKQERSQENNILNQNTLDAIPLAAAFIDKNETLKYFNDEFKNLFNDSLIRTDADEVKYYRIFKSEINEKISGFVKSSYIDDKFEINETEKILVFSLNKYFINNSYSGIFVTIHEKFQVNDVNGTHTETLDKILYSSPYPVYIFNKENLKFIEANNEALKLYGYTKDEFLNLDLTDLYTEDEMQTLLNITAENIEEGVFYGPYKQKRKAGENILIELSKISLKYKGIDACLNIIREVSERIELEKNNRLYKAVFDNSSDPIFITDTSGFITFTNDKVGEYLSYSREELDKVSFAALFDDAKRAFINSEIFNSKSAEKRLIDAAIKDANGNFYDCEISATQAYNYKDECDSFLIMVKIKRIDHKLPADFPDVINKKKAEEETIFSNIEVASQIFHEILTPINVISGFIQELTGSIDNLTPEQKEATEIIEQNRLNLLNIMNTVIDYINLTENIKLNIEEVKITDIIDAVQRDLKNLTAENKFQLSYGKISSSLVFKSDKPKFQSLLSLILILAARFGKEERLYISSYQYDEERFIIVIKDNYSFTSEELVSSLNSVIQDGQINKNLRISRFTDILVRKLLLMLGGSIQIIEENGKKEYGFLFPLNLKIGTIDSKNTAFDSKRILKKQFSEDLPVEKDLDSEFKRNYPKVLDLESSNEKEESEILIDEMPHQISSGKTDISKLTCLCIEDQIDSQLLFKHQMKELKDIKFASSFEEALPLLQTHKFDFILLDINLQGDYNGIDALKFIHKISGYENAPIIAATAYLLPGDKDRFISAGFDAFISKPIFHDNMVESLQKLF